MPSFENQQPTRLIPRVSALNQPNRDDRRLSAVCTRPSDISELPRLVGSFVLPRKHPVTSGRTCPRQRKGLQIRKTHQDLGRPAERGASSKRGGSSSCKESLKPIRSSTTGCSAHDGGRLDRSIDAGRGITGHVERVGARQASESRERRERRARSSATFRAVFEAAPYGVVVADEDGTILFTNDMANTTFMFAAGELIGQPISRLVPAASRAVHADHWKEFWKNPRSRGMGLDRYVTGHSQGRRDVPLEIGLNVLERGTIALRRRLDRRPHRSPRSRSPSGGGDEATSGTSSGWSLKSSPDSEASKPAALDETIVDSLRQIGEALRLDRAILWRRHAGEVHRRRHAFLGPGAAVPARSPAVDARSRT